MTDEQRARNLPQPEGDGGLIWLIYSREHNAFWRPRSAGYTTDILQAGRYTKAQADARCKVRDPNPDNPPEVAVLAPEAAQALTAKDAEIERLYKEGLYEQGQHEKWKVCAEAAEARIAELEGALKPFAEAAQDCLEDDEPDRCDAWEHGCAMAVNLGDFRRAASTFFPAALTPKEQESTND